MLKVVTIFKIFLIKCGRHGAAETGACVRNRASRVRSIRAKPRDASVVARCSAAVRLIRRLTSAISDVFVSL